ncbi:MAG: alpha/beta hydrolase, partial [Pedobacter sp.]|nr:alpha/beta hydrolase [Pedobacter sp.]
MKILKLISAVLMVGLSFTACRKIEEPSYAVVSEAKTMIDVAYGTDPKQKMDVYLPANRNSNTNVVIFVHGGSFIGGDKSEFNNQAKYLASRGYAVLNVNYRLVEGDGIFNAPPLHKESAIKIADQVNDLQKVVDFAVLNAKSWVMSSSRMGM